MTPSTAPRRSLLSLATRILLGPMTLAMLAPSSPASAVPECTPKADAGESYDWMMCGMPDLDQVRAASEDGTKKGLPGEGKMWCVPTSSTNVLSYMTAQGFTTGVPFKDWEDPANYNEAVDILAQLGMEMNTSASGGTGHSGWYPGMLARVQGTGEVPLMNMVLSYSVDNASHPPDPKALADAGMAGDFVLPVVGFYRAETHPLFGPVRRRRGGHMMTAVGASGGPGQTSMLYVHDPGTSYESDSVQTPYAIDGHTLEPISFTRVRRDENGEDQFREAHGQAWDLASALFQPSVITILEGYAKVAAQKVLAWEDATLRLLHPRPLPDPNPEVSVFDAPGPIVEAAFSAQSISPAFLVKGSSDVFSLDPLTAQVLEVGSVPGATALAFGGPNQDLFVAGKERIASFGSDGSLLAERKLPSPIADLAFDDASGLLVGITKDGGSLKFFNEALEAQGSRKLGAASLDGRPEIVVTPQGGLVMAAQGAGEVVKTKPVAKFFRSARSAAKKKLSLRLKEIDLPKVRKLEGLAVDDFGNILVTVRGRIRHFTPKGEPIKSSPYWGQPGLVGAVTRSFTNFDPATGPATLDELPADLVLERVFPARLRVTNLGGLAAGPFTVRVAGSEGEAEATFEVESLEPGQSVEIDVPCEFDVDRTAIVDVGDTVVEFEETNNSIDWTRCPHE